jgi:hypothetical protein
MERTFKGLKIIMVIDKKKSNWLRGNGFISPLFLPPNPIAVNLRVKYCKIVREISAKQDVRY